MEHGGDEFLTKESYLFFFFFLFEVTKESYHIYICNYMSNNVYIML